MALASWHPSSTAGNEAKVIAGQQLVIAGDPLVFAGASTDEFHNLGYLHDSVHFNQAGLDAHAEQWAAAIVAWLWGRPEFRRGDCNDDGAVDISDAVCILGWLFLGGGAPGCIAVTDTNGDTGPDLSDAVYLLGHLFLGGPAPVEPFPECGPMPDGEELPCETPPASCQ